jgi:arsenite-transporting ATPase
MKLVASAPRYLLFTGKGGVGKTSVACAAALSLVRAGKRVLVVSTDPASNLDEVFGTKLATTPTAIVGVAGLAALNLDPEQAARAYRERIVGPYRGVLPDASVRGIEEQLSGACTVEIAAFDEFSKLLGDVAATSDFDHVVFDTAPTGHTLRLLELPSAWSHYIEASAGGVSCLGPLSGLGAQRGLYRATRDALGDPDRTRIILVTRPEPAAFAEAERTRRELVALGIHHQHLVINGQFVATDRNDPLARALEARGVAALGSAPAGLMALPRSEFPLLPFALVGIEKLAALLGEEPRAPERSAPSPQNQALSPTFSELSAIASEIATSGSGVVFTMGKGGVGKTTVAVAVASELARLGHSVHLTATDPAADLASLGAIEGGRIRVSRIDARAETDAYVAEVLKSASPNLDASGRALLEEELRSPCTEEVAVFRAFARAVAEGQQGFVVIDTAPTGHTLLLLDAAEAYHREVSRTTAEVPEAVRLLLPRMRDPAFAKVLIVTLPEATPVHEARALERDLLRAGIRPFAWIINQSLLPLAVSDPTLALRRNAERSFVDEVRAATARLVLLPFAPEMPPSARCVTSATIPPKASTPETVHV